MTWLFYVMGMMVSHDLRSPPVSKWHFLSSVTSSAATAVSPEKNINFTLVMGLDGTPLVMQFVLYSRGIWYLLLWASSETSQWLQGGKSNSYFDSKWLKEIFYREIFHDLCFLKATSHHLTASEVFLTRSVFTRGMAPCWVHTVLVCRVSREEFHANFVTGIYRPYSQ